MADRYATNQFYNFGKYETAIGQPDNRQGTDNPKFLWPKDSVRNAAIGQKGERAVQRGYLRMITEAYGTDKEIAALGKRRLHFQFNPETLTRMVTARNDVQLWQNQDPFQFTQPIPGDSNFSFQLLFNREAEVASGSYIDNNGIPVKQPNKAANMQRTVSSSGGHPNSAKNIKFVDSDYNQSWVTDIGVLADLMVFDQIIGQGMNKELIKKITEKAEKATIEYNKNLAGKAGTKDATDEEIVFSYDKASTYLGTNIGNSAFLIAQPIRVVFSSTFMVEGFVSSTTVVFNKFNSAMIPTQCQIDVQMQAMYIGFANKDTYLTTLFKDYNKSLVEGDAETESLNKSLKAIGNNLFKQYRVTTIASELFKYNLNAERLYTIDSDTISQVEITFVPTEAFKNFAKEGHGTVSSTLLFTLTYLGRSGGGYSGYYAIGEEVYSGYANADFDMTAIKNGLNKVIYKVPVYAPHDISKPWDTATNAKYKLVVTIIHHITGSSGGDIDANQVATATHEGTWKEVWRVANSLSSKVLSDDAIAKERARA